MPIRKGRRAFGMKGNKIDRRPDLSRYVIVAPQAMIEEFPCESSAATSSVCTPDFRRGQSAPHRIDGVIVEFAEFLRCAPPITNVGLVPDLPIPGLRLGT